MHGVPSPRNGGGACSSDTLTQPRERGDTPGRVAALVGTIAPCYHFGVRAHPTATGTIRTSLEGPIQLANIKSQKKRILTNAKATERNKSIRSGVKTSIKKVHEAVAAGDKAAATTVLQTANRELDRAASKGVIHKNQAANRKSGLASAVDKMAD